jgi:hypothetical protein
MALNIRIRSSSRPSIFLMSEQARSHATLSLRIILEFLGFPCNKRRVGVSEEHFKVKDQVIWRERIWLSLWAGTIDRNFIAAGRWTRSNEKGEYNRSMASEYLAR